MDRTIVALITSRLRIKRLNRAYSWMVQIIKRQRVNGVTRQRDYHQKVRLIWQLGPIVSEIRKRKNGNIELRTPARILSGSWVISDLHSNNKYDYQ